MTQPQYAKTGPNRCGAADQSTEIVPEAEGRVRWAAPHPMHDDRVIIGASKLTEQAAGGIRLTTVRRCDILQELIAHPVHRDAGGPLLLAWDIRVHEVDSSGRGRWEQFPVDRKYEAAWNAYKAATPQLVGLLCWHALRPLLAGAYSTYPGGDRGGYQFATQGRNGGWLVLGGVRGVASGALEFDCIDDQARQLARLADADLARLYVVVRNLDRDLHSDAVHNAIASRYAALRAGMEADGTLDRYRKVPTRRAAKP